MFDYFLLHFSRFRLYSIFNLVKKLLFSILRYIMSVFSIKNQLNQSNVEVATKQDIFVDTMSLPVKYISFKNQLGPEVQVMDYNTIVALQGVAVANAANTQLKSVSFLDLILTNKIILLIQLLLL